MRTPVALADSFISELVSPEPYRFSRDRINIGTFKNLDNALALAGIVVNRFTTGSGDDNTYARQIREDQGTGNGRPGRCQWASCF